MMRSDADPVYSCRVAAEAKTTIVSGVVAAERPFIGATTRSSNQHHHHHPDSARSKKIIRNLEMQMDQSSCKKVKHKSLTLYRLS
jgi:hypothetical protein